MSSFRCLIFNSRNFKLVGRNVCNSISSRQNSPLTNLIFSKHYQTLSIKKRTQNGTHQGIKIQNMASVCNHTIRRSSTNIYGRFNNDKFEVIPYAERYKEQLRSVLQSYYDHESLSIGLEINLPGNKTAREELIQYSIEVAKDGISLLVREVATDKIVGSNSNKIQVKTKPDEKMFQEIFKEKHCKDEKSRFYLQALANAAYKYDIFTKYNTNCYIESGFISTLPEYGGKSIGKTIMYYTVKIAEELNNGIGLENVPEYLRQYRPACVVGTFSSNASIAIGRKLNFEIIEENSYDDIEYNGKKMSARIGNINKSWFMGARRL